MTPVELLGYLDVLRGSGVRRAVLVLGDARIEVELAPVVPVAALVDKDGTAVDLDEGNPWVATGGGDPLYEANFKKAR